MAFNVNNLMIVLQILLRGIYKFTKINNIYRRHTILFLNNSIVRKVATGLKFKKIEIYANIYLKEKYLIYTNFQPFKHF